MDVYLRPSSLGSYFGVGFNTPEQQFRYDTGQEEVVFDEESKARLKLGTMFEDTILNYFEDMLNVIITDRNEETKMIYGGKLHGRIDGLTMYQGEPAIVEAKMSNSKYKNFTENFGYKIQAHCYMMDHDDINKTLLLGLQNGKPTFSVINKDPELIEDIKRMTDFILDMMQGKETWDNYPWDLVEKYSGSKPLPELESMQEFEIEYIKKLSDINDKIKELTYEKREIEDHLKSHYEVGKFDNGEVYMTLGQYSRKAGYNLDRLLLDHPEIDLEKYRAEPTEYRTLRVKKR